MNDPADNPPEDKTATLVGATLQAVKAMLSAVVAKVVLLCTLNPAVPEVPKTETEADDVWTEPASNPLEAPPAIEATPIPGATAPNNDKFTIPPDAYEKAIKFPMT